MEVTVIDKEQLNDILYHFTVSCSDMALNCLRNSLSKKERKNLPSAIVEGKENSPVRCPVPNKKDQFILYYPVHSEPYPFQLDGMAKECYILYGEIHEKIKGITFKKGSHFLIPPDEVYTPYTTDSIAIALIIIRPPNYQMECELHLK
jgi:hypothetical protein